MLFFAHLDVVEARREDWSMDPFVSHREGRLFLRARDARRERRRCHAGRGVLRLRAEGWVPDRDLILALTADEEGGDDNGIEWLIANRRDLIPTAYTINVDAGGGEMRGGKMTALDVQASEKVFASFSLTVKNPGGHSSLPVKDNAIYRLAAGLQRLAAFEFPVQLTDVTRLYFARMAPLSGAAGPDMKAVAGKTFMPAAAARLASRRRSTTRCCARPAWRRCCRRGTRKTRLPQTAKATVNCRPVADR